MIYRLRDAGVRVPVPYHFLDGVLVMELVKDAEGNPLETLADIAGLSRHRKVLAGCLAMVMFSLAGIPPLFGFWGKFVVFQAAVAAGLVPLAAIGIAASVIGAFYYLKVVKVMYFDEPAAALDSEIGLGSRAVLILSTAFVFLFIVAASPIITAADTAARALFTP